MSEWFTTMDGLWRQSWAVLAGGADAPDGRYCTFASIGADGPEARRVALRSADEAAGSVTVHTDLYSVKTGELRADPRASIHVWRKALDLQIRLRGTVTIASGAAVADLWDRVPAASRTSYGVKPAPGTPIDAPDAYTRVPDFGAFAVLTLTIAAMDVVHLSPDYHRRVLYARNAERAGQWLAP